MATSIHDKISKLLALSASPNDNEAATALALAQKLMLQHGIDQDALNPTQKATVGETEPAEFKQEFQMQAAAAAAALYGCEILIYKNRFGGNDTLAFVGRRDNREIAQATWAFFLLQIEAWYKNELPKGMTQKGRAHYRRDYKIGMAQQLRRRCIDYTPASSGTALVLHKDALIGEIRDYYSTLNVRVKKAKPRSIKHADAFYKGISAGNAADIHKGVN